MSAPDAPWLLLSRWRALPQAKVPGQDAGWVVTAEDGREHYGPGWPRVTSDHKAAQRKADELNAEEVAAIRRRGVAMGWKN